MRTSYSWTRIRGANRRESGQVMVFVLLGLGTFLIGGMAFVPSAVRAERGRCSVHCRCHGSTFEQDE